MLKPWKIAALIIAYWGCSVAFGFWGKSGFPVPEKLSDGVFITAVATLLTAIGTFVLAVVTYGQLNHNRVVERAFVKASPSSISFGTGAEIIICLEIRNHGSTPAQVTDVAMAVDILPIGQALPANPPDRRSDTEITNSFLVSNDFFLYQATVYLEAREAEVSQAKQGAKDVIISGFVDYIDQFEQKHRAGFGRRYNQSRLPNIMFVRQPAYNYDRPL
jgi:hypothetical protein